MTDHNVFVKRFGLLLFAPLLLSVAAPAQNGPTVTLPGHVPHMLASAARLPVDPNAGAQIITLGVMLNLSDPAAFDGFHQSVRDSNSPEYHRKLRPEEFAARFGPTQQAHDAVLAWLQQNGFTLVADPPHRRVLTVRGTRAQAEAAFHVTIGDYQLFGRTFHANANDPAVPAALAPLIAGVSGFSNLGIWRPAYAPSPLTPASTMTAYNAGLTPAGSTNSGGGLPPGLNGSGQTIGLIEFDNYNDSDVANWLAFAGLPASLLSQVSRYDIAGGTSPSNGNGTTEVLLDIAAALGTAPGAKIVVFDTPSGTDFYSTVTLAGYALGGTALSMSWNLCEDEISSSDASNMDSLLLELNSFGITFFTSTGDNGSTCKAADGTLYPNSISFPADDFFAVAVGGTTLSVDASNNYQSESWWLNQGGYGLSQYIYGGITGYYTGARSVPDVSIDANPGIKVCQAAISPNCFAVGGTSLSAPLFAGIWALAYQAEADTPGSGIFPGSGTFYQYPEAFHPAASMTGTGNDFAHVGLGSPDVASLISQALQASSVDSVSPDHGPWTGGTKVTIHGSGFIGVKKVKFGGVDATNVTVYSDTKLTADSPVSSGDQVDIQVITPLGATPKSSKDLFSYTPVVTGVSPNSGPVNGGTSVTVTGEGFSLTGTSFSFGSSTASKVSCSTSKQCTMVTPSHGAGVVNVSAETSGGNSSATPADQFTFLPVISEVNPNFGSLVGGDVVTVIGNGLDAPFKFNFGGAGATSVACTSSTSCTMISPAHSAGTVDVIIETPWGNSAPSFFDQFLYSGPVISSISPSVGPTVGGQGVTLTGIGLDSSMTVNFGSTPGSNVLCAGTSWSCTVSSPPGTGTIHITATLAGLTSPATSADLYTYAIFPSVASVSPWQAPVTGGIPVTITGTNFSTVPGGTTIKFGTLPATGVSCSSTTQCTATAPVRDPSAGYLKVSVTATMNGHTSLQYVPFEFGTPPPPPPPPPCGGTTCN